MNILEVFTVFSIGGVQRHILALSDWLRQQGHQVWIGGAPGSWLTKDSDDFFLPIPLKGVRGDRLHLPSAWRDIVSCSTALRKLIIKQNIDIIHAHEIAPAFVSRLATIGLKVPVILSYHGASADRFSTAAKQGRWLADRFIAVSDNTAKQLAEFGLPRSRIATIPYGIKPLLEPEPQAIEQLRSSLLGRDGKILIVSVARLHRQKGIDVLIAAAAEIVKSRSDIRFVVVGNGSEEELARNLIQKANLNKYVHLAGGHDNPRIYLEAADIFVLASRWEALPLAIPEAYRAGLPVVATDVGGVAEIVSDRLGAVVPSENPIALAKALLKIASDNKLREEISVRAYQEGQAERFDPEYVHSQIEGYYQETTASRSG